MAQLQEKYQSAYTGADLDAAIARSKNITATDTELNYSSGVTSAIQTQIDGKSTVSVAAAGTATEEVQYITIDGVEKKLAGGGGAEYTAGTGIKIEDNVISNTLKVDYGEIEEATPLCFTALTAGSRVRLTKSGSPAWTGSYSTDGTTWQTYTPGTTGYITLTNVGDKIYFKGVQTADFSGSNYLKFGMSGSIAASGSCMSLWCGDNFATATAIPYAYAGAYLFQECSALKTVSADFLPAITLTNYCYRFMFSSCSGLTTPPALPATTLTTACYQAMFQGCTALTSVPALPTTALVSNCYTQLCYGCTSLIVSDTSGTGYDKAWKFPTEGTFTHSGYATQQYMFTNCEKGSGRTYDDLIGYGGQSYTYYTQNEPIVFPTSNKSNESNTKNVKLLDEEGNEINVVSKQDKLTAGDNITIDGTTISATDTKYTAGSKISISGTTISTTANQVSVSATGTATEEVQYITIDGVEKKLAGGGAEYTAGTGIDITNNVISNTLKVDYEEVAEPVSPLCLTALTAGSEVNLEKSGSPAWTGSYSTDGSTWQTYTPGTTGAITLANVGDKIYFKGTQTAAFDPDNDVYLYFSLTGSLALSGNFMSFVCGDDYATATALPYAGSGARLFDEATALASVTTDFLPATTLTSHCYDSMFQNCSALVTPPRLPATTVTASCYYCMFYGCEALTSAPALPATNLADASDCYYAMFTNCSSLIISDASGTGYDKAWRLPTEGTFTHSGYQTQGYMFFGCPTGSGRQYSESYGAPGGQSTTFYIPNDPVAQVNANDAKNVKLLDEEGNEINVVAKQDKLTAGENITIDENNVISAAGGAEYTAGVGIDITDNVISNTLKVDYEEIQDTDKLPLTLTALTAGSSVRLLKQVSGTFGWTGSYSTDGENWTTYTPGTTGYITLTNVGDKVYFKGVQTAAFDSYTYLYFSLSGSLALSGNFMSFVCGDDYLTATTLPYAGSGRKLFYQCTALKTVSANFLPATTLTNYCYREMFSGCTGLTTPPALPATTLTNGCYQSMFQSCSALTSVPALPATSLSNTYYQNMFYSCTSLVVSDTSGTGYDKAWRIPTEGTFTHTGTVGISSVFTNCAKGGGRASDSITAASGGSCTYYTQNEPIVFTQTNISNDAKKVKLLDEEGNEINIAAKQDVLTAETDITVKTMTGGITYVTEAPTAANTDGMKIAVLTSEPATKYDGWLYIITE